MKTYKHIILLFIAILFYNCGISQNINYLTTSEYNSVKINGKDIVDIDLTKGDLNKINTLLGVTFSKKTSTSPSLIIELWSDTKGLYFYFEDGSDTGNNYDLLAYEISNNQSNITVKGKTVTIGSNISELGNIQINASGTDIVFGTSYTDDILMIKFDSSTNLITNIEYTSFN